MSKPLDAYRIEMGERVLNFISRLMHLMSDVESKDGTDPEYPIADEFDALKELFRQVLIGIANFKSALEDEVE